MQEWGKTWSERDRFKHSVSKMKSVKVVKEMNSTMNFLKDDKTDTASTKLRVMIH